MRPKLMRTAARVAFYISGVARDAAPYGLFERRRRALFDRLAEHPDAAAELFRRCRYYNRMTPGDEAVAAGTTRSMPLRQTYYYYDLKVDAAKYFGPDKRLSYIFGDVIHVPDEPAIVKSRPVAHGNENSVVMKLDRLRHFNLPKDVVRFQDKLPYAVWRGAANNPVRTSLMEKFAAHSRHDVGFSGSRFPHLNKRPLSIVEQQAYRYVISVEGHDVATNLKWVMASNSLCLMPKPRFETWFMEGSLQPGAHYVEVRDDFADLEDKVAYYEANPSEAAAIIARARAHVYLFRDRHAERLISLLVLQKYFECTGQIGTEPFSPLLYGEGQGGKGG